MQLPKRHCWRLQDWAEFSMLDSKQIAQELRAPLEEVEAVLYPEAEKWCTQEAPMLADANLGFYVAKVLSRSDLPYAKLFAGMFRTVLGESVEEFADRTRSWRNPWQNYV